MNTATLIWIIVAVVVVAIIVVAVVMIARRSSAQRLEAQHAKAEELREDARRTEMAARANPDGHTYMIGSVSTMCINPALHKKLPFDTVKDLAPVSLVASTPSVLVVTNTLAAKSIKELIALEEQLAQLIEQAKKSHEQGQKGTSSEQKWNDLEKRLDALADGDQRLAEKLRELREGPPSKEGQSAESSQEKPGSNTGGRTCWMAC